MHVSAQGLTECVNMLMRMGADVNRRDVNGFTALTLATLNNHITCVESLITAGADVNIKDLLGQTALIYAVNKGHFECVTELLKGGADGNSSLHWVVDNGKTALLDLLVLAGADVNSLDKDGVMPLMKAVNNGHIETVQRFY